jgi:hypothetical protein
MIKCKFCGQRIDFIQTAKYKSMPINHGQVIYFEVEGGSDTILTLDGRVIRGEICGVGGDAENIGYIPHFTTCAGKLSRKH